MLPVVAGNQATVRQIWFYTVITVTSTVIVVLYPLHASGIVYVVIAMTLGGIFLHKSCLIYCRRSINFEI